jgi:hypothetical protein
MQLSWNTTSRVRLARLVLVTASAAALASVAACGPSAEEVPLTRAMIKVQSITQQGSCEDVNIKVTPETILPNAPKLSNGKEFITPVHLTVGEDKVSCTGDAQTIPMSPGKWKLTANLPSQIATCERDIADGSKNTFVFKDGEVACTNPDAPAPAAAPAADAAAPAADAAAPAPAAPAKP